MNMVMNMITDYRKFVHESRKWKCKQIVNMIMNMKSGYGLEDKLWTWHLNVNMTPNCEHDT